MIHLPSVTVHVEQSCDDMLPGILAIHVEVNDRRNPPFSTRDLVPVNFFQSHFDVIMEQAIRRIHEFYAKHGVL